MNFAKCRPCVSGRQRIYLHRSLFCAQTLCPVSGGGRVSLLTSCTESFPELTLPLSHEPANRTNRPAAKQILWPRKVLKKLTKSFKSATLLFG